MYLCVGLLNTYMDLDQASDASDNTVIPDTPDTAGLYFNLTISKNLNPSRNAASHVVLTIVHFTTTYAF